MIPNKYKWLESLELPKIVSIGLETYGTTEIPGQASNQKILNWAKELGISYGNDDIPWCGLWMAYVVKQSGREPVKSPLWARNWAKWGDMVPTPELGDIVVFARKSGGHVGVYIGEDSGAFHILGGNQSNAVNITRIAKLRAIAYRRPKYQNKPISVKKYPLDASGDISTNES